MVLASLRYPFPNGRGRRESLHACSTALHKLFLFPKGLEHVPQQQQRVAHCVAQELTRVDWDAADRGAERRRSVRETTYAAYLPRWKERRRRQPRLQPLRDRRYEFLLCRNQA